MRKRDGLAIGLAAMALAGCGGGGGGTAGGGGAVSSEPVLAAPDYAAEATRNWGLAAIGAPATTGGQGGLGSKVAVIDTGIDLGHPDFAGAIAPDSLDIDPLRGSLQDVAGHGTAVAGVAAARRNGHDALGVAHEATILAVRADAAGTCPDDCRFRESDLARATDYAVAQGAAVLNYSLGGTAPSGADFEAALRRAAEAGRIVVAAAGNTGGAEPLHPALFAAAPEAQGMALAVGAVDETLSIAAFSNRAGTAMEHFLVAPGVRITTTALGGGVATVSGTSFAAPHVAGAAAVLLSAFPYLTARQVADLLLTTATDLGAPGVDAVYGRGLVDLAAAMRPQGPLAVPSAGDPASAGTALSGTALLPGAAFGDSLNGAAALRQAAVLDAFGRAYRADLGQRVVSRTAAFDLGRWLRTDPTTTVTVTGLVEGRLSLNPVPAAPRLPDDPRGEAMAPPAFAFSTTLPGGLSAGVHSGRSPTFGLAASGPAAGQNLLTAGAAANPYLSLAGGGLGAAAGLDLGGGWSVSAGFVTGRDGDPLVEGGQRPHTSAFATELRRAFASGAQAGVLVGRLDEEGGPLGSRGDGALHMGRAATVFAGVFGSLPLSERASLFAAHSVGRTTVEADASGLFGAASAVVSESALVGVSASEVMAKGDRLTVGLARPLRVASGRASLTVPHARAADGSMAWRSAEVDLSPSGGEYDLDLGYALGLAKGHDLGVNMLLQLEPGHEAGAGPEAAVGLRYRMAW